MGGMTEDSTRFEVSLSEIRVVAGYAVACTTGLRWRSSKANALTTGGHETRSKLRRRSRMERSEPKYSATQLGRHSGRPKRSVTQDGMRPAKLLVLHSPQPVQLSSTPSPKQLKSSTSSDRPRMPHEHSNFLPVMIRPSEASKL